MSKNKVNSQPEDEILSIGKAAKFLGKTTQTLRNWDSSGVFKAMRSPTGYRQYRKSDLLKLIQPVE